MKTSYQERELCEDQAIKLGKCVKTKLSREGNVCSPRADGLRVHNNKGYHLSSLAVLSPWLRASILLSDSVLIM